MSRFPPPYIVEPTTSHSATVILLHGRGSTGEEFADELFEAQSSDGRTLPTIFSDIKWVFPTSKLRHSTVFQEMMTEWFDIYSLSDPEERQDLQVEGLRESTAHILDLVDREIKSVGGESRKLILGGISQGCAVAIHALLAGRHQLGAFIGFCTWLPFMSQLGELAAASYENGTETSLKLRFNEFFQSTLQLGPTLELALSMNDDEGGVEEVRVPGLHTPCFLSHCEDDDVVDITLGRQLRDTLKMLSVAVTWDEHDEGGHWIQEPDAIDRLLVFISSHLQILQATS